MFLIENGYLKRDGFSVKLPNGFYLQTYPATVSDHEIHFVFKDELSVIFAIDQYEGNIEEDLKEDINNGNNTIVHDITEIYINGMKANYAVFKGNYCQFFIMNIEPKSGKKTKKVKVIGELLVKSGIDIIDLLKEKEFKEFIENITMD